MLLSTVGALNCGLSNGSGASICPVTIAGSSPRSESGDRDTIGTFQQRRRAIVFTGMHTLTHRNQTASATAQGRIGPGQEEQENKHWWSNVARTESKTDKDTQQIYRKNNVNRRPVGMVMYSCFSLPHFFSRKSAQRCPRF